MQFNGCESQSLVDWSLTDEEHARIAVEIAHVRVTKMKTRWGTSNTTARRIWLNLEPAKKRSARVEYILVHEMIHLVERQDNERFRELLNAAMPSWRVARDELNSAPAAHEGWAYKSSQPALHIRGDKRLPRTCGSATRRPDWRLDRGCHDK